MKKGENIDSIIICESEHSLSEQFILKFGNIEVQIQVYHIIINVMNPYHNLHENL